MGFSWSVIDKSIAKRLTPLRNALASLQIPVAAIPNQPGQLTHGEFESVTWAFVEYRGIPPGGLIDSGLPAAIKVTLAVYLSFDKRYLNDSDSQIAALEWVEEKVLGLLGGWEPDGARSPLEIVSGRLFEPMAGRWQKEIRFSFETLVTEITTVDEPPAPLVKKITVGLGEI